MNTKEWYIIDAKKAVLGRLASKVASVLRGKHKPTYLPYADNGDFIIVVNAGKVKVTGNKMNDKLLQVWLLLVLRDPLTKSRDRHFPPWWWDSVIFKKTFPPWERGWWDNLSHHGPEAGGIVFLLSHHGGGTVDMGWPAAGGKFW